MRAYIEQRYGLRAPRLATEEFLRAASQAPELPPEHRPSLGRFLEHCDLFKFGRYQASASELGELHAAAIRFVMASLEAGVPPAEAGAPPPLAPQPRAWGSSSASLGFCGETHPAPKLTAAVPGS